MRIWSIQPVDVFKFIEEYGYYICKPSLSLNCKDFKNAYDWLVVKMKERIGKPMGVNYPVWAWHTRDWKHKKPDLRESGYETKGMECVCIEIEIPDNQVVLSDFTAWHFVLNKSYLNQKCYSEEIFDRDQAWLDSLSPQDRYKVIINSWNNIFDIQPFSNGFLEKGRYIQATFWVLRKRDIKKVQFFKAR